MRKPKKPVTEDLTREQKRVINMVLTYASQDTYLEDCEKQRRAQEAAAADDFERAAREWEVREAERKRLWGKKFPRVLGQKPDEPINPVKSGKTLAKRGSRKRARTNLGG